MQHVSARETVEVIERAKAAGTRVTCEATPHHLLLTDEAVRSLDTNFKMNPPLRAEERPPGADRGAALGRDRLRGHRPRARTRARRRSSPSSWRRWASRASRPPSRRSTPRWCCPGVLDLGLLVERMTAGGEPFGLPAARARARARRPTSASSTSTPSGRWARRATRAARPTAPFAGRRLTGRVRMTSPPAPWPTASARSRWGPWRERGLPAARGRHALRRRGRPARRRGRPRRGGVQHLDVGLPGGRHRPELPRPDHRLHLPADRQLRRLPRRTWSPTASTRAR